MHKTSCRNSCLDHPCTLRRRDRCLAQPLTYEKIEKQNGTVASDSSLWRRVHRQMFPGSCGTYMWTSLDPCKARDYNRHPRHTTWAMLMTQILPSWKPSVTNVTERVDTCRMPTFGGNLIANWRCRPRAASPGVLFMAPQSRRSRRKANQSGSSTLARSLEARALSRATPRTYSVGTGRLRLSRISLGSRCVAAQHGGFKPASMARALSARAPRFGAPLLPEACELPGRFG